MRDGARTELCIFDLDGTLLNTIDDIADSLNRVLRANHYPTYNVAWYKEKVGHGAKKLLEDALPPEHGLDEKSFTELLLMYKEDYRLNNAVMTKPYDGIPELLRRLGEINVKIAVISNKPHESTCALLKKYFRGVSFVAVYGEKPGMPIKPDPSIAYGIIATAGASPEQTLIIGDAEVDMIFAERASIFSIGVLWGFRNRAILEKHGAKAIIETPGQILEYIGGLHE